MGDHSIAKVLEHYGSDPVRHGSGYAKIRCPFHNDSRPSASVNLFKQRFHCFVCDFDGDAIAVIRWQEGCSFADAKRQADEISGESGGTVSEVAARGGLIPRSPGNHARDGRAGETWRLL